MGALGVWLAPTLDSPPEVHLWRDVDAVVHGRARTDKTRSWFLGVRLLEPPVAAVSPDVQAALDGTASLDAIVPGVGRYVADLVRDGRRLRVRTVRGSAVASRSGLERAVAAVAPGTSVEIPEWPTTSLGAAVGSGIWSLVRSRR